jgi:hypothetical protein
MFLFWFDPHATLLEKTTNNFAVVVVDGEATHRLSRIYLVERQVTRILCIRNQQSQVGDGKQ